MSDGGPDRARVTDAPDLLRRATTEGIGTFMLVLAGCGAIITNDRYHGSLGPVGVSLTFGLVIMIMVAAGSTSGAHYNPGVSIAFTLTRHFPARGCAAYVVAQIIGATAAAGVLRAAYPSMPTHLGATVPSVGVGSALVLEAAATFALVYVIYAVATDTRNVGAPAAIAIGGAVAVGALWTGSATGGSFNTARSFGPAIVSGEWHQFWIYVVGPMAGAVLGALAYQFVRGEQPRPPTVEPG